MRDRLTATLLASAILIPALTQAQQASLPTVQRDPQAIAILQRALAALGGATQPLPASLSASGSYIGFGAGTPVPYSLRMEALGPDKVRWDVGSPSGTVTTIIRGTAGWRLDIDGTEVLSVADLIGKGPENIPLWALANWASSSKVSVAFVGPENLDEKSVYHLSLSEIHSGTVSAQVQNIFSNLKRCDLFVDQQTNLPARLRYYEHPGDWQRSIPVDLVFSDFRNIGGLLFPFSLTRYVAGQLDSQIQFQSIQLNVPLSDAEFQGR